VRAARMACAMLVLRRMPDARVNESWTIPLHVVMWAVIAVGVIMMIAVILMH